MNAWYNAIQLHNRFFLHADYIQNSSMIQQQASSSQPSKSVRQQLDEKPTCCVQQQSTKPGNQMETAQQKQPQPQPIPITLTKVLSQDNISVELKMDECESLERQMIKKVQKNIRAHLIRNKLKQQFKKINRRRKIIKELIDTQEAYIRDLGFIVSDFKMRMQSRDILTQEEGRKLFSNVDEIRQLHDIFFSTLYNHFNNYHPYLIIFADVLNSIFYFRIYIQYLNNFPLACDLVDEFKHSKPQFANFVSEIARSPQYRFLSIEDYMVKPVQRLPKYVLLLKQLIKNTSPTHPDYMNVKKALQQFEQVNNNNNEKLSKIRNNFKLRELESMLQLSDNIITPSTEFILEETVQILSQDNDVIGNCVVYLLNNMIIVTRRLSSLLNRTTHNMGSINSHIARINRASGMNNILMKEKLQTIVPIKYGTSIKIIKDQAFFKNSFTVQSPQGQSCTFICASQQQLYNLYTKVKKQSDIVVEQTMNKLKSMFQGENISINHNSTFIKGITLLDLVPEVTVLGTSERTDKMLKYTVYIVQVKVKMIRQKIFLRFSQLLELQRFINKQYKDKIEIKQGLVSSSWLNNHHQKTIEERKMNIQRFLKQILSKPQVIQNGWRILLRLGLPIDFYELPQKILQNKNTDSFIKKNASLCRSTMVKRRNFRSHKNASYRLSLFQQQKIQQQDQQRQSDGEEFDKIIKQQLQPNQSQHEQMSNTKQSYLSSNHSQGLCIQDILKANQIDLGHYTRTSESAELGEDSYSNMQKIDTFVAIEVLVPCLESIYCWRKLQGNRTDQCYPGFRAITVKCLKLQRIQNVIPLIAKQIKLKYYKDFRLLIQKQYSQRALDDDQLVHKIVSQINRTKSVIVFRKMIYIDLQIQQRQLTNDKRRLTILAGQIINQIKMGKYRLNYECYLKFAVLTAIFFQQCLSQNLRQNMNKNILSNLAKQAKINLFPKYSSLSQTEDVWIKDFAKAFQIINKKLQQIVKLNTEHNEKNKTNGQPDSHIQFNEQYSQFSHVSNWATTSVKFLALLSIIKQIQKKQYLFGCVQFPVQISEQFKNFLEKQYSYTMESEQKIDITKETLKSAQKSVPVRKTSSIQNEQISRKLSEEQNKNCWLAIRNDKIFFASITKSTILLQLPYQHISKIETYASSITLTLKNLQLNKVKLKTTSSYYIREMLIYYRNYRAVLKKLCSDSDLKDSIIQMAREEIGPQQMDEYYL